MRTLRTRRPLALGALIAGVVAATAGLAPASAPAATGDPVYDVTMEADVQHRWSLEDHVLTGDSHLEGVIGQISLERNGNVIVDPATSADATVTSRGTYVQTGTTPARSCSIDEAPRPNAVAIRESLLAPLDGSVRMDVRFGGQLLYLPGAGLCPEGAFPGYVADEELGDGPLDAVVQMPREVIGRGKTIELVHGPQQGRCPGSEWGGSCSLRWEATLTLTLVGHTGDMEPAPLVPPAPTPTPTPTPTEPDDVPVPLVPPVPAPTQDDDVPVPLVPPTATQGDDVPVPLVPAARASAARDGSSVAFRAACPAGCVGTATLTLGGAALRAAGPGSRGVRLAVAVPARPGVRTIRLAVPRRHRRALRAARTPRLTLALRTTADGAVTRRTLAVRR